MKRKLLLTALCVVGALGFKANAQVADGDYYLYDAANGLFLSRGGAWGTEAMADKYGVPFTWKAEAGTIIFKDWAGVGLHLEGNGSSIYTDNGSPSAWKFTATEGGYYFQTSSDTYVTHAMGGYGEYVYATAEESSATVWTLKTKAEHDAIVAAYPTDNINAVIAAASLSTDAEGFSAYLTANYASKDVTDKIGTAKFAGSIGDWTWTQVRGQDRQPAYGTNFCEIFQATGHFDQTIEGLTPGLYKVTVNGFNRIAGFADCNTLGGEGYEIVTSYLKANDQQVQLKSWYSEKEGEKDPDNTGQAVAKFNEDKYKNEVYTYVGDDGKLTLTVAKPSGSNASWVLFNNFTLTYYSDEVSDEDAATIKATANELKDKAMQASLKTTLNDALSAFETTQTIANYNALAAAITPAQECAEVYANIPAALPGIKNVVEGTNVYTQAAYEVYQPDVILANYEAGAYTKAEASAIVNPEDVTDWHGSSGAVDDFLLSAWTFGGTQCNRFDTDLHINTWSTEGAGDGSEFKVPFFEYWTGDGDVLAAKTMQATKKGLNANTEYTVSIWARARQTNSKTKAENGITMTVGDGEAVDISAGTQVGTSQFYLDHFTAKGKADAEGNLTITITVAAESNVSWLSFRDCFIEGVVEEDAKMVIDGEAQWGTFVAPFAVEIPEGVTAYTVEDVDDEGVLELAEVEDEIPAYPPVVVNSASEVSKSFHAPVAAEKAAKAGLLTGVLGQAQAVDAGAYVLQNQNEDGEEGVGFYKVPATEAAEVVVEAGHAYLTLAADAGIKALRFPGAGEATAIANVAVKGAAEGAIYNVAGQKVSAAYKGIVIKNGKKYLQK